MFISNPKMLLHRLFMIKYIHFLLILSCWTIFSFLCSNLSRLTCPFCPILILKFRVSAILQFEFDIASRWHLTKFWQDMDKLEEYLRFTSRSFQVVAVESSDVLTKVYPKYVKNKEFVLTVSSDCRTIEVIMLYYSFFYIFKGEITKDEKHLYN